MDDTTTKQVTFTKEEYDFLFRCLLAENNRLNRGFSVGAEGQGEWGVFIHLVNSVLPKLTALTEFK